MRSSNYTDQLNFSVVAKKMLGIVELLTQPNAIFKDGFYYFAFNMANFNDG